MGNVNMEARQVHYRGGNKPMSVEEAIKEAGRSYVLPVASAETLGGVKVGEGLSITEAGVLSALVAPNYSTEEQKTGQKWLDGKDIYVKIFVLDTPVIINAYSWHTVDSLAADTILNVGAIDSDNGFFPFGGSIDNGNLKVLNMRNTDMTMAMFIVYYTKIET